MKDAPENADIQQVVKSFFDFGTKYILDLVFHLHIKNAHNYTKYGF